MTEPTIAELADQLRTWLAKDEQGARAAGGDRWTLQDHPSDTVAIYDSKREAVVYDEGWPSEEQKQHIARHDPARVLAEVASKRALLDLALGWSHDAAEYGVRYAPCEALADPPGPCDCGRDERVLAVLQHLAQPYQKPAKEETP